MMRIISVNVVFLGIGLLVLELFFGDWYGTHRLNRLNLTQHQTLIFDVSKLYSSGTGKAIYKKDAYGFRGPYTSLNSIDILTLGGSTTEQKYITEGNTWQDILRQDFKREGKIVNVVNAGVDGQSTYGHIKDFDWWFAFIPDLKVNYFLFFVGLNDFFRDETNEFDDLLKTTLSLKDRSVLYHLFRTFRGIWLAKIYKIDHHSIDFKTLEWVETQPNVEHHEVLLRDQVAAYDKRLKILAQRVRKLNGTPIFVTQPHRKYKKLGGKIVGVKGVPLGFPWGKAVYGGKKINGIDSYLMMKVFNEKTLEVCREVGGICIDLASELEFDDDDFYDFAHNTPEGAEKIGHYLHKKLAGIFDQE